MRNVLKIADHPRKPFLGKTVADFMTPKPSLQQWHSSVRNRPRRRRSTLGVELLEHRVVPVSSISNFSGIAYDGPVPPDTDIAVGSSNIVETVNSEVTTFDKGGNALFSQSISDFFNTGGDFISDPRVIYDNFTNRFFIVEMEYNSSDPSTATQSFLDIAISNSSDAFAGFAKYQLNSTEYDPSYGTLITDYPTLGWNADGYVMTQNMYGQSGFAHIQIITIDNSLNYFINDRPDGQDTGDGQGLAMALDPVRMHDALSGGPEWFIESDGSGSTVRLVEMNNPFSRAPTFSDFSVSVPFYGDPSQQTPPSQPDGSTFRLDSRMLDGAMRNNELVAAQTISDGSEAVARWYVIELSNFANPVLRDSGNIFEGQGVSTFVPGIDIAPDMGIGLSYLESSPNEFVSMYATGRNAADPSGIMEFPVLVAPGQGNFFTNGQPGRVGDMSGVGIDPNDGSFWVANEYANASGSWNTAIEQFTVGNTNDLTVSGVNITATANQLFAGVVATITDPDQGTTGGTIQATIYWGDGQSSVATVNNNGNVSGSHVYAQSGSFSLTVQVTDAGNESGQASSTATVNPGTVTHSGGIAGQINGAGQWWVGLSNGSSFVTTLWGSWNPNDTWVDVQTGDFTGDGKTDIVGRDLQTGAWWVGISTGSSFIFSPWTAWAPNVTWVDVKVGDFTGDGKADIAGRVQQTGQWWVAQSTGSSFVNSLWTTWAPNVTWVDVQVGDFTGNGKADIAGRVLESGQWWVAQSTGSSFINSLWTTWAPNVTWVDVQVGDFTGNGKADIAGRVLESGQWWVAQSSGSFFSNSLWTTWAPNVNWVDVKVGDFTGDGKADIIGRVLQSGQWWVGLSTGSSFTNSLWTTWSPYVTWVDVQVGEFTGDGKMDITGRVSQDGSWWTGLSNGSAFVNSFWGQWPAAVSWTNVLQGYFD